MADYDRGIELNPKNSKAYYSRAGVHAKKKEYDAAVADSWRALELDPKNGDYYLSLGWYQLFNRKPREAIAAFLKALELSPSDAIVVKTNLAHGYTARSRQLPTTGKTHRFASSLNRPKAAGNLLASTTLMNKRANARQ